MTFSTMIDLTYTFYTWILYVYSAIGTMYVIFCDYFKEKWISILSGISHLITLSMSSGVRGLLSSPMM